MNARRRHRGLLGAAAAALALLAIAWLPWPAVLLYNPSVSAPRGWYLQSAPRDVQLGEQVFAQLPPDVAVFAHHRGYLPSHLPILKRIGATAGQHVCVRSGLVRIDGRAVALVRAFDGAGRPLAAWPGCRTLARGEVFLFAPDLQAFDGRYFGPVERDAILGEAVALWTW